MSTVQHAFDRTGNRSGGNSGQGSGINVGDTERVASVIGGGLLVLYGLTEKGLGSIALPLIGGMLAYRGLTGHCSVYSSLGVNTAENRGPATAIPAGHGYKVEETVTVDRPADDLYMMWRQLDRLPEFMQNVKQVQMLGHNRSRWVVNGPLGAPVEWEAEIINERPGELIAWKSAEGSVVSTAGSVHFTPSRSGHGTDVHVSMKYDPPGGKLGANLAWLMGASPEGQLRADLQRFKKMAESGEAAATAHRARF